MSTAAPLGAEPASGLAPETSGRETTEAALREADEFNRQIIACVQEGIVVLDRELRYSHWNPYMEGLSGLPASRVIGRRPWEVFSFIPEWAARAAMQPALEGATTFLPDTFADPPAPGRPAWVSQKASPLRNAAGRIIGVICTVHDITDRKKAEDALREREQLLTESQRIGRVGAWRLDPAGPLLWSQEACRIFGVPPESNNVSSELFLNLVRPADRPAMQNWIDECLAGACPPEIEFRIRRPDGAIRILSGRGARYLDPAGRPEYLAGTVQDVTERKEAEESLRLFRTLIDRSNDKIEVIDPDTGRFLDLNDNACQSLGYTREEFLKLTVADIDPNAAAIPWLERMEEVRRAGSVKLESLHRRKDGTTCPVEVNAKLIRLDRDYLVAVVRDISDRKQAEAALHETSRRLGLALQASRIGVWSWDVATGRVIWDDRMHDVFGLPQGAFGGRFEDLLDCLVSEDRERVAREFAVAVETGDDFETEYRVARGGGDLGHVAARGRMVRDEAGKPVTMIGVCLDNTDRKRLETQFLQAQKMDAVGRLAGGVAHDFNNLLTAIIGFSELALMRLPADDRVRADIAEVKKAGERGAELTRQLLAFSRKQVLSPQVLNLNEVVADMRPLLQRLLGEHIEMQYISATGLGSMKADRGQVEQVILNLCVNARDAMPLGGRLTVETFDARSGSLVVLAIGDTGVGMSAETQSHLFEPFYTTKKVGKGTGLGLATIHGIVSQSGGHIAVRSVLGKGTTFEVSFPRVDAPVPGDPSDAMPDLPRGTETVLLVEDSDMVREMTRDALKMCGYRVLEAAGGAEALEIRRRHPEPIPLLLTDVVMPNMNGRELMERMLAVAPDMKVICMSGYNDDEVLRHGIEESQVPFLQKPFSPTALAIKVRQVLDAPPPHDTRKGHP